MKKIYLGILSNLKFSVNYKKRICLSFAILVYSLMSLSITAQSVQTLPLPSNNNQTSYASAGGLYGPMAATATANQYSRYAYVYPQSLIGTTSANATGSIGIGDIITNLEFDRGFTNTVTMNATANFKIYLINLSAATTNWGAATLNWTTQTAASTLVYNASPAALINAAAAKPGNVSFPITAFTYTGGALGVLVEYTQTTGQTAEISWGYENNTTVTDYVNNSALGVVGTGAASATLTTPGAQSVRHPTFKIDFTVPNDNCAGAYSITPSTTCIPTPGSNFGATVSSGVPVPTCAPTGASNDVWYSFTADGVSTYTITVDPNSARWTTVVYNGACGALTQVACAEGASSGAVVTVNAGVLSAGVHYYRTYARNGTTDIFNTCVTYTTPPVITGFSPTSACAGTTPTITLTGTNFTGATAVKFNGVNATPITVVNATTITVPLPSTATTGPVTVTTPAGTGTSGSNFTINPIPTVTNTPLTQTICSGGNTTLVTLTSGVAGATFAWTATATAGVSGFTTSGTSTIPVQTISTTGTTQGTVTYAITPTANGCTGSITSYTVLVNPKPAVTNTPLTQTICSGGNTSLVTLTGSVTGSTFAWTATATAGVSGFTASGTGTIPIQTISTTATSQGTVTYAITPTATGCPGAVTNYTVLVNPKPVVTNSPLTQTICSGGNTSLVTLTSNVAGATFAWTATATAGVSGFTSSGTGTIPIQTISTTAITQGTVTYAITPTATGCPGAVTNYTVLVNPAPTVNIGGAIAAICQGGTTSALGGSFGGGATSAVWSDGAASGTFANNTGSTPGTTTYTASGASGTPVTLTLTTTGGLCGTTSDSKTLTINANPTVSAGGAIAAICQGGTTTALGGTFGGGATAAVWSDGAASGTFTNNAGATPGTATYTASATSTSPVTLTLTTSGGACGITADNKTLTVNPNPTVNAGGAIAAICQGGTTVALGGSFGGGATSAVWSDGAASGTFANNSGATPGSATYTASASSSSPVTLTLTTSGGSCGPVSDSKTLTVYQSVAITGFPNLATQTLCAASNVTYTVSATGSGLTYQWQLNGSNIVNGGRISGATSSALTITGLTLADDGDYTVIVSGSSPCTSATSAISHLDVDQKIIFSTQPVTPQTICQGQTYTISAFATGTVGVFQWYKNGSPYAMGTFDGANTYTLSIPGVIGTDAGSYRLLLDDGTGIGCTAANSNIAVLTVNPTPTATISGSTTVCQSSTPAPLVTFTNPNALSVTITYNINLGTNLTVNVNANASATIAAPTGTAGTFDYNLVSVAYQSGPGCSNSITGTATITVSPTPDAVATPASQSICSGDAITTIALTGSVAPTTFNWTRNNASVTGIATSGNGDISGSLTNATNAPITVTFTITPTAAGCVGTAITATVVVNPTSSVNTVPNQTVCNNTATTAINFSSPTTGGTIVYNWTNNTPSIGLASIRCG